MKSKMTVYVASPYTIGDVAQNVRRSIDITDCLIEYGFAPFCPLYSHFHQMIHPRSWETWMDLDYIWVKKCDALLRLDGESKGADLEVEFAIENNIPVFYEIPELLRYRTEKFNG